MVRKIKMLCPSVSAGVCWCLSVCTAWFTFFPSFVASGTKNTYVECTKALRHLVSTYLQYDMNPPPFVPFCFSTESSTGSRYWKTSPPRRAAGSHKLELPKGLIAPYASNEAIKRLGSTGHPEAAARRGRRRFPLLTACRALRREAKRHEGGGFHIVL